MENATKCCKCHSKYCSPLQSRWFHPPLKSLCCTSGGQKCPYTPTGMEAQITFIKQCNIVQNIKTKFHVKFNSLIQIGTYSVSKQWKSHDRHHRPTFGLAFGCNIFGIVLSWVSHWNLQGNWLGQCLLDMNVLILHSARTLGLNNRKTLTFAHKQAIWWCCKAWVVGLYEQSTLFKPL